MKYALFIGRFQPFHKGHEWLIDQKLGKGIPVMIHIRDVPPDDANPLSAHQVREVLNLRYAEQVATDTVRVRVIGDIESVNYGRGVGYAITEHVPPDDIKTISGTQIRNMIKAGDNAWKEHIDPSIQDLVAEQFASLITMGQSR